MLVKNNVTGKQEEISKAAWDAMGRRSQSGFTILSIKDKEEVVQVVENKRRSMIAPDPGDKKAQSKEVEKK